MSTMAEEQLAVQENRELQVNRDYATTHVPVVAAAGLTYLLIACHSRAMLCQQRSQGKSRSRSILLRVLCLCRTYWMAAARSSLCLDPDPYSYEVSGLAMQ
jgi:hypothetical protein